MITQIWPFEIAAAVWMIHNWTETSSSSPWTMRADLKPPPVSDLDWSLMCWSLDTQFFVFSCVRVWRAVHMLVASWSLIDIISKEETTFILFLFYFVVPLSQENEFCHPVIMRRLFCDLEMGGGHHGHSGLPYMCTRTVYVNCLCQNVTQR